MKSRLLVHVSILAAFLIGTLILRPSSARSTIQQKAKTKFSLSSAYQKSPIDFNDTKCHMFSISGTIENEAGTGKLTLDPNTCSLNTFGDTHICTEIAPIEYEVKLRRLRTADPRNLDRRLFSVTSDDFDQPLFFVMPTNNKASFRLVVGAAGDEFLAVVTLEPNP